ncbi:killer cell lectin-like receptor subfamily B member 1B allele C [Eublepharis macularius]|uniref:Killer cell lectin-like receptor subfamily B member 1B allele C n=1 Tax=Eublepharis macularius TaxID=481883 RepID=A0AA97KUP0_EUBMA|nr:killer cell lectin-like receptor subfamily B member 1B allele C [Eublepharis macularius]
MANEVIYADLNLPEAGLAEPPQACYSHHCPRWHHVALRVGGAGYILLLVAVIVLSVCVIHSSKPKLETSSETEATTQRCRNRSNCSSGMENLIPYLKQHVCEQEQRRSTENTIYPSREKKCFLCPKDWLFHGNKCYNFFGKAYKDWNKSNETCTEKNAQLLVIREQEEKGFIENITKTKNAVWIGLQFNSRDKKFFWMDGSPLQKNMNSLVQSQHLETLANALPFEEPSESPESIFPKVA